MLLEGDYVEVHMLKVMSVKTMLFLLLLYVSESLGQVCLVLMLGLYGCVALPSPASIMASSAFVSACQ